METAWFGLTIERLMEMMRMPPVANEYGCAQVTAATVREALGFLMENMPPDMPAPRIVPLVVGGLAIEFEEYWVSLTLLVPAGGTLTVNLHGAADWFEPMGASGEEAGPRLFARAVKYFERLRKEGPPEQERWKKKSAEEGTAEKPDDG